MASILLRRKRVHNPHNNTSFEAQWAKDQAKLEARRANTAARNAAILGRLQKDPQQTERERIKQAADLREYMTQVKEQAALAKAADVKEAEEIVARENKIMREEADREQTKRDWSATMMKQNRDLCEYRYAARQAMTAKSKADDANLNVGDNHFMSRFGTSLQ